MLISFTPAEFFSCGIGRIPLDTIYGFIVMQYTLQTAVSFSFHILPKLMFFHNNHYSFSVIQLYSYSDMITTITHLGLEHTVYHLMQHVHTHADIHTPQLIVY